REFAIFRIPYFDADGLLAQLGLKFYHSDWSGHTNRLTTLDFYLLLRRLRSTKFKEARLYGREVVEGIDSPYIIPLSADMNTSREQALTHDHRAPAGAPSLALYKEVLLLIRLEETDDPEAWRSRMEKRCRVDATHLLFHFRPDGSPTEHKVAVEPETKADNLRISAAPPRSTSSASTPVTKAKPAGK